MIPKFRGLSLILCGEYQSCSATMQVSGLRAHLHGRLPQQRGQLRPCGVSRVEAPSGFFTFFYRKLLRKVKDGLLLRIYVRLKYCLCRDSSARSGRDTSAQQRSVCIKWYTLTGTKCPLALSQCLKRRLCYEPIRQIRSNMMFTDVCSVLLMLT